MNSSRFKINSESRLMCKNKRKRRIGRRKKRKRRKRRRSKTKSSKKSRKRSQGRAHRTDRRPNFLREYRASRNEEAHLKHKEKACTIEMLYPLLFVNHLVNSS